jgi:lipoprotein-anchoring transpeptidase ErfK/SrfK
VKPGAARYLCSAAAVCLAGLALGAVALAGDPPEDAQAVIAPGVSIDGVDVSGLTASEARAVVLRESVAPRRARFVARIKRSRFPVYPARLGYTADVDYAIKVALLFGDSRPVPEAGVNVRLRQKLNAKRLRAFVRLRAARHLVPARDAALRVSASGFKVTKARVGRALKIRGAERTITRIAFAKRRPTGAVALPVKRLKPRTTSAGPGILINRNTFTLKLFRAGKIRTFPIAVGQVGYSTPAGRWSIVNKQRNPWWYPPPSPWAEGSSPVPPGPGNPLGTRWMGLSATFIGIHGTPASGSLGSRASHGCIRMRIGDAEWLYDRVQIGTTVVIV